MTAPLLDQLFRVIEHLDEAWAVPCERMARSMVSYDGGRTWLSGDDHCGGQNPAEWILYPTCPCPPNAVLYCTSCRDTVLGYLQVSCDSCGEIWMPASRAVRLIEPLNRRTT